MLGWISGKLFGTGSANFYRTCFIKLTGFSFSQVHLLKKKSGIAVLNELNTLLQEGVPLQELCDERHPGRGS